VTYLVDSDVLIDYLAGRGDTVTLLQRLEPSGLGLSIISYAEVYEGIYRGRDPKATERRFREALRRMSVLALSQRIGRQGARIRGDLRARGLPVPMTDVLIAATAIHHDLTLVTRNLRHYERIPGLTLYRTPVTAT
jgi:tRNA(fMet)-specific endonuclease VapC